MSCIFCRIVAGEIPAETIAKDEGAVAFLDIQPLADGHAVIVPRKHVARVEEMAPEDAASLFRTVVRLVGPVRKALGADATTIGINDGEASGQTVPHVHVHIVPRWKGDGEGTVHTIFHRKTKRTVPEAAAAIRKVLGG